MRILTAGESHGVCESAIIEGFPKGVTINEEFINQELRRRMLGYGRGGRMEIESDTVEIICGMRNKKTLGSPISILVKNKDARIFASRNDNQPKLSVPRPSHADLAAALKYGESDVRNILERSSARETVMRVGIGSFCKQLLNNFGVNISSFTTRVGVVSSSKKPVNVEDIISKTKKSQLNCLDTKKEKLMIDEIDKAIKAKDTLGGVVEIWCDGLVPGIGNGMHFDRRLDALIAQYVMAIPAIKGVEIGLGFEYARKRGSSSHDQIYYSKPRGFYHTSNNSGGIEGGMSNGEPIVIRAAMKPIATLMKPLDSVDLVTKAKKKAIVERSDTCAIASCGVIAESVCAIVIANMYCEQFGCDSLAQMMANFRNYIKKL